LLYRPEIFAAVSRLVGASRILFATDYPLLPHRRVMAQLEENHLETSEAAAILGENAQRLLHL
jgi:predicted TIM-barrel fold metal-dependent hydrolase